MFPCLDVKDIYGTLLYMDSLICGPGQFRYTGLLEVGKHLDIISRILATILIPRFRPF